VGSLVRFYCPVASVKTGGKDLLGIPNAGTVLRTGDIVTVYGEEHHIHRLFDKTRKVETAEHLAL